MRFQNLFFASILSSISIVAAGALESWTKVAQQSSMNVIKLDDQTFDQLITPERNYTSIGTFCLELRFDE
jgi:hypothetical protein